MEEYLTRGRFSDVIALLCFQIALCFLFVFEDVTTQLPTSFARCHAVPAITDFPSETRIQNQPFHLGESCAFLRIQWHTKKQRI